jgi:phenylpropionate dioxygenase-like ring-hydroxylating dioxygenase large terminal subunit
MKTAMNNGSNNSPGGKRAAGPSVADVLKSDPNAPPAPLLAQAQQDLGDADIPCSRYTSADFFEREMDSLWPRTWQWACRDEHLQEAGDHYVYEVGRWSVIVVRGDDHVIRAFMNSCTHRGTKILGGVGSGYSEALTCPFHGWSWQLDGSVRNIPARWDFPHTDGDSHGLRQVNCDTWGGFVFINIDTDAKPLLEYLDVLPEHFSHYPLENRRVALHVQKTLPANWKAAQEAFLEAYHNFETHNSPNGANAQYDIFGKYVSRFIHTIGSYSVESLSDYPGEKWRNPRLTEAELLAHLGMAEDEVGPIPEGETARSYGAQKMREGLQEKLGVDLSDCSDSLIMDSIEYHLFPNMFLFPGISIPMIYRFRPLGMEVDRCIFDLVFLEPRPADAPEEEPPEPIRLEVEQSYTEVEALGWLAPVYDQDTGNLQLQQEGFRTSRKKGLTLGDYQEARIRRIHLTLDELLDG